MLQKRSLRSMERMRSGWEDKSLRSQKPHELGEGAEEAAMGKDLLCT